MFWIGLAWVMVCIAVLGGCAVATVRDRRLRHAVELQAAIDAATCQQCSEQVPAWFLEDVAAIGALCFHCSAGWPYPEARQTEDQYASLLAANQAETQRLEDARIVTCPVCEKGVEHGKTSRAAVEFSTTPGRQIRKDSSVCFVCMEEHVGYGMPLVVGTALTWKRKENADP